MNRNTFEERGETADGIAVKIVQNIYGNWYGYAGGKRVEWFMGATPDWDAKDWFRKVISGEIKLQRRQESDADFKARLALADGNVATVTEPISKKHLKQPESVADFKHRLARQARAAEGRPCSIVGAAHSNECVVRPRNVKQAKRSAVTEYVRAGDQLGARYGVEIKKKFDGLNDVFFFRGAPVAHSKSPEDFVVFGQTLPKRAARALGHFLINNAREQR